MESKSDSAHLPACLRPLEQDLICFLMTYPKYMRPWKLLDTHYIYGPNHLPHILSDFMRFWLIWCFSHVSEPKSDFAHLPACLRPLNRDWTCFLMTFLIHMRPWKLSNTHYAHGPNLCQIFWVVLCNNGQFNAYHMYQSQNLTLRTCQYISGHSNRLNMLF